MTDLAADIDRGSRAQALLSNPMLTEAFTLVAQAIHEAWETAPVRDTEGQHLLKLQLKLLGDVRANLEQAITDGKLAAHEIDRRRTSTLADFRVRR
jgi:hypothetical protein